MSLKSSFFVLALCATFLPVKGFSAGRHSDRKGTVVLDCHRSNETKAIDEVIINVPDIRSKQGGGASLSSFATNLLHSSSLKRLPNERAAALFNGRFETVRGNLEQPRFLTFVWQQDGERISDPILFYDREENTGVLIKNASLRKPDTTYCFRRTESPEEKDQSVFRYESPWGNGEHPWFAQP